MKILFNLYAGQGCYLYVIVLTKRFGRWHFYYNIPKLLIKSKIADHRFIKLATSTAIDWLDRFPLFIITLNMYIIPEIC